MTIMTNAPQGANASALSLDPIVWASHHPDAELLAAWEAYCGHYRTIDALPESDAVRAPHMEALAVAHDRVMELSAHTPAGALVKAKLAFIGYEEAGHGADAVIYEKSFPADVLTDCRERMMMALIGDLERMVGVSDAHTPGPVKGVASTDTLGHPDAGLLATFEAWKRAGIAAESLPDDVTEEDRKLYWDRVYALRDAMEEFHPQTMAGAMAMLLFGCAGSCEAFEEVIRDTQPQDPADFYEAMLWRGITALKGINAASSADAALLSAFSQWRNCHAILLENENDEVAIKTEWEMSDFLSDAPVEGGIGAVVKMAFLAYMTTDHYGHDDPEHPSVRAIKSLKASADGLPPVLADAVRLTADSLFDTMKLWSDDCQAKWELEKTAKKWQQYDQIFRETGAYDREEKNKERSAVEPKGQDGLSDNDRKFVSLLRQLPKKELGDYVAGLELAMLGIRIHHSLKALKARTSIVGGALAMLERDFGQSDSGDPKTAEAGTAA